MHLEDWALKRSRAISFILGITFIGVGLIDFFVGETGKNSQWGRYLINIGLGELYLWIIR